MLALPETESERKHRLLSKRQQYHEYTTAHNHNAVDHGAVLNISPQ